jgi:hypothetical protein
MALDLSSLPSLDGAMGIGASAWRRPSRRQFLAGALAASAALAFRAFLRPAWGHVETGTDYNIGPDCGGVNYPDCGGCQTTNRIIGGCCTGGEGSGTCPEGNGYHKHNHSQGFDLRPNVCPPTSGHNYSGWLWLWSGCCILGVNNCKKNRKWRCHDGEINDEKSICRWVVSSGTDCTPCPSTLPVGPAS